MVVVLPAPFAPRRAKISPGWTSKLTPFSTSLSLKDLRRSVTWIAAAMVVLSFSGGVRLPGRVRRVTRVRRVRRHAG